MHRIRKASIEDTEVLDYLLTMLIRDEKKYDLNINEEFEVKGFYKHIIMNKSSIIYVAEENNKIIGYIYGYIESNETNFKKTVILDALYINNDYRNKGVATNLVNNFKRWSIENEAKYIEVQVLNKNIDAFNLYKGLGFKDFKSTLVNELD